jgi:hypothetical protein
MKSVAAAAREARVDFIMDQEFSGYSMPHTIDLLNLPGTGSFSSVKIPSISQVVITWGIHFFSPLLGISPEISL